MNITKPILKNKTVMVLYLIDELNKQVLEFLQSTQIINIKGQDRT